MPGPRVPNWLSRLCQSAPLCGRACRKSVWRRLLGSGHRGGSTQRNLEERAGLQTVRRDQMVGSYDFPLRNAIEPRDICDRLTILNADIEGGPASRRRWGSWTGGHRRAVPGRDPPATCQHQTEASQRSRSKGNVPVHYAEPPLCVKHRVSKEARPTRDCSEPAGGGSFKRGKRGRCTRMDESA